MKRYIGKIVMLMVVCGSLSACNEKPPETIVYETETFMTETVEETFIETTEEPETETETEVETEPETWNMDMVEEVIEIEGLTKEYSYFYLTDMHIVTESDANDKEAAAYATERAPLFVNAQGESSVTQFENRIAEINRVKPDGALFGGDFIDSPSDSNLAYLGEKLGTLEVPYLYTPGNHDWTYPWAYMDRKGKKEYLPKLYPFMQNNPSIQTMENDEFIIVSIDNSTNQIAPEAMEGYKEVLQKGKPVIVMLHVPLFSENLPEEKSAVWKSAVTLGGGIHGGIYPNAVSEEFINLTKADDSPVVAVLTGHVHFYHKEMLNEKIVQIGGGAGYLGEATLIRFVPKEEKK